VRDHRTRAAGLVEHQVDRVDRFNAQQQEARVKGWRTLLFNAAGAVLGVLIAFDWDTVLPAKYVGAGAIIVFAANMGLRYITDTPVGKST
jgi:hypothetical protein